MLTDSPRVRQIAYYIIAALGVIAIVLDNISTSWAAAASNTVGDLIVYLSTVFGIVAGSNVNTKPPEVKP